jgi:hypothetical protein
MPNESCKCEVRMCEKRAVGAPQPSFVQPAKAAFYALVSHAQSTPGTAQSPQPL